MMLAGDYGGSNAIANRQGALARRGNEPGPSFNVPRMSSAGGMITTGSSGRYSKPKKSSPPPQTSPGPIDINSWLGGDTGYQDQLRQFAKSLSDFQADYTRRQGNIGTDYATSSKALGDQRVLDLKNIESDYGSRGLIHSGLYGKGVGDYENEYNQRLAGLTTNRDQALTQLLQENSQFSTQQELQKQLAREQALKRRAEGLGGL